MLRFYIIFTIALLSVMSSYAQKKDKLDTHEAVLELYLDGIQEMFNRNNSEKAATLFLDALKLDPEHAPSHYHLSLIANNNEEMLEYAKKAAQYDPTNTWYNIHLSRSYATIGDFDNAIIYAQKILAQSPKEIEVQQMLISMLSDANRQEEALDMLNEFEKMYGTSEETFLNKLRIYEAMPPTLELAQKMEGIAQENQKEITPLLMAGDMYLRLGDNEKGVELIKQAEAIDSTNWRVIVLLADANINSQNFNEMFKYATKLMRLDILKVEARAEFVEKVLFNPYLYQNHMMQVSQVVMTLNESAPMDTNVGHLVAQHYAHIGMLDEAEKQYRKMISIGSADQQTYYNLIGLLNFERRYDEMITVSDSLSHRYPETLIDNTMQKAYALMELDRFPEAVNELEELLPELTDDVDRSVTIGFIADIQHEAGNIEQSYKLYEKAIKIDPENWGSINNYCYYLSLAGKNLKKAKKMSKRVAEANPENGSYIDTYGWILYLLGEYQEAEVQLARATELDAGTSPDIMMHYGDVLSKNGKTVLAKVYWKRAEEAGADPEQLKKRGL